MIQRLKQNIAKITGFLMIFCFTLVPNIVNADNLYSVDFEADYSQYARILGINQTGLKGELAQAFTIEAWVKFESVTTFGRQVFVSKQSDSDSSFDYQFAYEAGFGSGSPLLAISSNGLTVETIKPTVAFVPVADTWYHLAVTYNGSLEEVKFYVNGTQLGTTEDTNGITELYGGNAPFIVGARADGANPYTNFFDGKINNLRVWNVARSGTEISDNQEELITSHSDLISAWYAEADNHEDMTISGNDLTAYVSPTFSTDVPFEWVEEPEEPIDEFDIPTTTAGYFMETYRYDLVSITIFVMILALAKVLYTAILYAYQKLYRDTRI